MANPVKLASSVVGDHRIGQFPGNGHFGVTEPRSGEEFVFIHISVSLITS
jgi:hypothetical protein